MIIDSNSLLIQSNSPAVFNHVGVDGITIHVPNGKIKDWSKVYLIADDISIVNALDEEDLQHAFCLSDQTVTGYLARTKYIPGISIKIIVHHGIYIKITPCKIYYKHNLFVLSIFDFIKAWEEAKKVIREIVDGDLQSAIISKIDLCRNIEPQFGFETYELVFRWLKGNRQARTQWYPSSYYWMNREKILIVYDKLAELAAQIKNQDSYFKGRGEKTDKVHFYYKTLEIRNLLEKFEDRKIIRVETRLYTKKLVKDFLGVETMGELLEKHTPALYEQAFISQIRRMVLCREPELSQKLEFQSQLELLQQCQKQFKSRAVSNFDLLMGLPAFLDGIGTIERYKALLEAAGYSKSDVSKYLKHRRELLELSRSIDGAVYPTGSTPALYKEFFDKALEVKYAPQ